MATQTPETFSPAEQRRQNRLAAKVEREAAKNDRNAQISELANDGKTVTEIAQTLGVRRGIVKRALGLSKPRAKKTAGTVRTGHLDVLRAAIRKAEDTLMAKKAHLAELEQEAEKKISAAALAAQQAAEKKVATDAERAAKKAAKAEAKAQAKAAKEAGAKGGATASTPEEKKAAKIERLRKQLAALEGRPEGETTNGTPLNSEAMQRATTPPSGDSISEALANGAQRVTAQQAERAARDAEKALSAKIAAEEADPNHAAKVAAKVAETTKKQRAAKKAA